MPWKIRDCPPRARSTDKPSFVRR